MQMAVPPSFSSNGAVPMSWAHVQGAYARLNSLITGVGTDMLPLPGDKDDAWLGAPTTGWKIIYKS